MGQDLLGLSESKQSKYRRQLLGFVLQTCNLFEHSTVYENVEYPLIYNGVKRRERRQHIEEALKQVQLSHRFKHPSNRLSGGEQQRVAIARALVNHPRLILADEPTGQLDETNGQIVMDTFRKILKSKERATILVTHDEKVANFCDHTYTLSSGILTKTA
jgi:putative ABC transport system ATP-binding protein